MQVFLCKQMLSHIDFDCLMDKYPCRFWIQRFRHFWVPAGSLHALQNDFSQTLGINLNGINREAATALY